MKKVSVSAPCRIDFSGGTLDLWPLYLYTGGLELINMAINVRATAEVSFEKNSKKKSFQFEIESADMNFKESYESMDALRESLQKSTRENPLRWVNRVVVDALALSKNYGHWTVRTKSEAPPGSGLGGSSVLGVALYQALLKADSQKIPKNLWEVQTHLRDLECTEIAHPAGEQDYVPALFGGLLIFHLDSRGKKIERLSKALASKLGKRMALLYTGKPHHSGINNWQIFRDYHEGNLDVRRRLHNIREISAQLAAKFRQGDIRPWPALIQAEWEERKKLSPAIAPTVIEDAWAFGKSLGASACKACGAGGGGCIFLIFDDEESAAKARKSPLPQSDWRWLDGSPS